MKKIYKTGLMNDPDLTDRLYECGATFTKDIDQQTSPILSFLVTGLLPLIIFIVLGNYMAKKLMEQAGGKNSMAFGMGKSNARVYVQSSEGIRFSDVAGEDEAKENLAEIVDYLHNPKEIHRRGSLHAERRSPCKALQVPVKQCLPKPLPEKRMSHSFPCPALNS